MRILHTSDWHLGLSTGPASRAGEQAAFLDWLLLQIDEHAVDVLLVAGDVFDSMHPPAEAQALYYGFLARVAATGLRDVVVVGGNHDSASRLDAPAAVLQALRAHVVGGVPPVDGPRERMIAPLRARGSDEVVAACLAVPYVHEYRLGVRTSDLDRDRTRADFREAFSSLYSDLADAAEALHPGVPLVATGHLTLGTGSTPDDYPMEIHQVGRLEGLPVAILDPRIRYAALGHIHRAYPVADSVARYCGSPVPYSLTEMSTHRRVLLVDVDPVGAVDVQGLEVPRQRDLLQLVGSPDEVLDQLRDLRWDTPLPPLVHVRVVVPLAEPGLLNRLHEAAATHPLGARPVLVEVQQRAPEADLQHPSAVPPPLESLRPEQVFALICDGRGLQGEDRDRLVAAFNTVASADAATLQAMLDDVYVPPTTPGSAS